ncbi:MAG TPA: crossover junction endodeoxyribonuclease RuvC [Blastocatellia bacterium]|nr:crossover junction endodeoxyribonuclease RuvC [Blastocatellia bacterium]
MKPSAATVRVLGIDPGSESMGFGIVDTDGRTHRLVTVGAIRAPRNTGFPARLLNIENRLCSIIEQYAPQVCSIEETFFAANVKTALKLGHVRGVAIVAAARAGLQIFEYSPAAIKSALVGYGRAEKAQVGDMVRLLLNLAEVPQPHDAADALATAICHIHTAGTLERILAAEAGILKATGRDRE